MKSHDGCKVCGQKWEIHNADVNKAIGKTLNEKYVCEEDSSYDDDCINEDKFCEDPGDDDVGPEDY